MKGTARYLLVTGLAALALAACTRWLPEHLKPERAGQPGGRAVSQTPNEIVELNERIVRLRQEGRIDEAIPLAQRAVSLYESAGPGTPYLATALHTLAELHRAAGDYAKAEPEYQRALSIQEKTLSPYDPDVAITLNNLALLYRATGRLLKAEALHQRALDIFTNGLSSEHVYVARTLKNLAQLYRDAGDYNKSESFYRRAIAMYERVEGLEHPDVAVTLVNMAEVFEAMKDYARAESTLRRALDIDQQAFGPNHPRVAVDLTELARLLKTIGSAKKAEPLLRRALDIREQSLGPDDPLVASSLNDLAVLYTAAGDSAKAEPFHRRALEIREKTLSPNDPLVASTLNNLALLYVASGEYAKAEPLYRRALEIQEKTLGPSHPDVGPTLNNLATLYKNRGEFAKARELYERALQIQEKAPRPVNAALASTLHNYAGLHDVLGEYAAAEPMYRRALELREKTLSLTHPDVAATLSELAALYDTLGDFKKAEPLYVRALAIREKSKDQQAVAAAMTDLADLYRNIGNYAKAETLLQRALAIHEDTLGSAHPAVAADLTNLAELYRDGGMPEKAEPLLRRALGVTEQVLDRGHPLMAVALGNLGQWYISKREYKKAVPLLRSALAVNERIYGPDHPEVAGVLNNLALAYRHIGSPPKAEALYARVLKIREQSLGPDHFTVAQGLTTLGEMEAEQRRYVPAAEFFKKALVVQDLHLQNVFPFTADDDQAVFTHYLAGDYVRYLSLVHQHLKDDKQAVRDSLEAVLRRKGAVLDARSRSLETLPERLAQPARAEWTGLTALQKERAQLLLHRAKNMRAAVYRDRLESLGVQINDAEQRVAAADAGVAREQQQRAATVEQVSGGLPQDTALIEFVKIRDYDFAKSKWKASSRYLAYVLNAAGETVLVDLGDARGVESLGRDTSKETVEVRRPVKTRGKKYKARHVRKRVKRPPPAPRPAADTYTRIWAPLEAAVGPVEKILISPDGALNTVPFAALRDKSGRFLVERYQIAYLTSGRELVGRKDATERPAGDVLVVANPAFAAHAGKSNGKGKDGALRSRDFSGGFAPLPRAARDGQELPPVLNGGRQLVLAGERATESALKSVHGPRVLHVATHGFFLKDQAMLPDADRRGKVPLMRNMPARLRVPAKPSENPLLRSGLALAGASFAADILEGDDGLLTALDISGMDLEGTELVTLSACRTAEGAPVGDAIYALRRAFALAGAHNVLMSLWSACDERSAKQVNAFYEKWQTLPPAQALREVQLDAIRELKASGGKAPPKMWASFFVQGAQALGK